MSLALSQSRSQARVAHWHQAERASDCIAVVAGHPTWRRLAAIEASLGRLVSETGGSYIGQTRPDDDEAHPRSKRATSPRTTLNRSAPTSVRTWTRWSSSGGAADTAVCSSASPTGSITCGRSTLSSEHASTAPWSRCRRACLRFASSTTRARWSSARLWGSPTYSPTRFCRALAVTPCCHTSDSTPTPSTQTDGAMAATYVAFLGAQRLATCPVASRAL